MDSEKDKKVKRIARFLELGGTMLAEHCKVCGAPRFRYQGKVICPICDVKEEGEEEEVPEPVAEIQAPETSQHTEKVESSFEPKKRVQTLRQKPRFGLRTSEATTGEKKTALDFTEEDNSKKLSATNQEKITAPAPQTASSESTERQAETSKVLAINKGRGDGDREVLENLLFKKIVSIATSFQDQKNPRDIAEDLELINKGLELIERLRKI
ncbi:MAG: hypothetical protein QG646_272 [Euryarchaeota archaeon]|nr:hypothetical protein [Euryarchaeota archaeon]